MKSILILSSNPFVDAFLMSDILGKLIFMGLILLSVCTWIVLIYKGWQIFKARKNSLVFKKIFMNQMNTPLAVSSELTSSQKIFNCFLNIYLVTRKQSMEILRKNRHFTSNTPSDSPVHLSPTDIDAIESQLYSAIALETKQLESQLYLLSTIVSLAPFLGLLGTVWGILTTFSELQTHSGGTMHQMVLGGLSLALATTVMGLIDAIPALIGYNYLKNAISAFQIDMESFALEILTAIEMQYRQVNVTYRNKNVDAPSQKEPVSSLIEENATACSTRV